MLLFLYVKDLLITIIYDVKVNELPTQSFWYFEHLRVRIYVANTQFNCKWL